MTELIPELFRLNSRMLMAGDRLVTELGLTSARWQILGCVAAARQPQPVAWFARDMGANRQNIQRIVNDLEREGLVAFRENPHHRRAQLVVATAKGQETFEAAMRLQAPWVNEVSEGLRPDEIEAARNLLTTLRMRLEALSGPED